MKIQKTFKRKGAAGAAILLFLLAALSLAGSLFVSAEEGRPESLEVVAAGGGILRIEGEEELARTPGQTKTRRFFKLAGGGLPSSYRTQRLTDIQNQGSSSLCWAYAALDAGQIGILKDTEGGSGNAFSAAHLGYASYNGGEESWVIKGSSNNWMSLGGNGIIASSTLLRWYGAAPSASYTQPNTKAGAASWTLSYEQLTDSCSHLIGFQRLPGPNDEMNDRSEALTAIKKAIHENGAVALNLYFNRSVTYDAATCSSYMSSQRTINHQVVLVGWDDEKITKAAEKGAFLAKNTYGTGFGEDGLFWISYSDQSMDSPFIFTFEKTFTGGHSDTDLYSYDGIGYWYYLRKSGTSVRVANVFTAARDEQIDAVGFYVPAGGSWRVEVLTGLKDGDPSSGTAAVPAVTGSSTYFGFCTVRLPEAVTVEKGQDFAVCVRTSQNGMGWAYFEGSNYSDDSLKRATTCGSGETFISVGGSAWTDIQKYTVTLDGGGKVAGSSYGNACIKAYGNPLDGIGDGNGAYSAQEGKKLKAESETPEPTVTVTPAVTAASTGTASPTGTSAPAAVPTGTPSPTVTPSPVVTPSPTVTPSPARVTVYNGVDYSAVYDFDYYMAHYPSLKKKYGKKPKAALRYFVKYGMKKMQRASKNFDVKSYVNEYSQLRRRFGTNWKQYYLHYIKTGSRRGWHGTGCARMKNPLTRYKGKDYRKEYDFHYYIARYSKVKKRYRYDDYGALAYYVKYGRRAGQKAKK